MLVFHISTIDSNANYIRPFKATELEYLELSKRRYEELLNKGRDYYINKVEGLIDGVDYSLN